MVGAPLPVLLVGTPLLLRKGGDPPGVAPSPPPNWSDGLGARPVDPAARPLILTGTPGPRFLQWKSSPGSRRPCRVTTTRDGRVRACPAESCQQGGPGRLADAAVMAKASTILVSTSTRMLSRMKPRFTFQTCRIHSPRVDGIRPLPSMASLISRLPSTTLAVAGSLPGTTHPVQPAAERREMRGVLLAQHILGRPLALAVGYVHHQPEGADCFDQAVRVRETDGPSCRGSSPPAPTRAASAFMGMAPPWRYIARLSAGR